MQIVASVHEGSMVERMMKLLTAQLINSKSASINMCNGTRKKKSSKIHEPGDIFLGGRERRRQ